MAAVAPREDAEEGEEGQSAEEEAGEGMDPEAAAEFKSMVAAAEAIADRG